MADRPASRPNVHPALRVPLIGGGPVSGDWHSVRWTSEGIPVLVSDPDHYLAQVGADIDAPLDGSSFGSLAYLARYLPLLLAPNAPLRRAIRGALQRHVPIPVALAVELGCGVGADLRTLADVAHAVIGVDLSIAGLRAAQRQLAGEPVPLLARVEGRSFRSDDPIHLPAVEDVFLVVGNALDPPLFPEVADIVCAVNLLDTVPDPLTLVGQADAVLKPGGLFILTSPLSWNEEITEPEDALGGGTAEGWAQLGTAAGLALLLQGQLPVLPHLRYEILEQTDVPWSLREHSRSVTTYDVHVLVARKL